MLGKRSVASRIKGAILDVAVESALFFITPHSTTLPATLASALATFLIISDLFLTFRCFPLDRSSVVDHANLLGSSIKSCLDTET